MDKQHMSARRALEVLEDGEVSLWPYEAREVLTKEEEEQHEHNYRRAREIMDACVTEHELLCELEDDKTDDHPTRLLLAESCIEAVKHTRRLERGEEA